jgi:hypothetical protein
MHSLFHSQSYQIYVTFTYPLKKIEMTATQVPGIQTTHDAAGEPTQITINLKEHPEVIQPLKALGLLPKTQFDIEFEEGHTVDEFRQALHTAIKEEYANRS